MTVIDKNAEAFDRYPPGERRAQIVGLGFDRDVLEEAGIKEADAFIAVSQRRQLEHRVGAGRARALSTCPR